MTAFRLSPACLPAPHNSVSFRSVTLFVPEREEVALLRMKFGLPHSIGLPHSVGFLTHSVGFLRAWDSRLAKKKGRGGEREVLRKRGENDVFCTRRIPQPPPFAASTPALLVCAPCAQGLHGLLGRECFAGSWFTCVRVRECVRHLCVLSACVRFVSETLHCTHKNGSEVLA